MRRQMFAAVVEQLCLLRSANQPTGKRPRFNATVLVKLSKMGHRLLNDAATDPHAANKVPITVNLSCLSCESRSADTCTESKLTRRFRQRPKVSTTRPNPPLPLPKSLIQNSRCDKSTPRSDAKLRKLG